MIYNFGGSPIRLMSPAQMLAEPLTVLSTIKGESFCRPPYLFAWSLTILLCVSDTIGSIFVCLCCGPLNYKFIAQCTVYKLYEDRVEGAKNSPVIAPVNTPVNWQTKTVSITVILINISSIFFKIKRIRYTKKK